MRVLATIVFVLLLGSNSHASTKRPIIAAVSLAPIAFVQGILIHETAHLSVAKFMHLRVWEFEPYPHVESKYGHQFVFGWIVYGTQAQFTKYGRYWPLGMFAAPYANDILMFAISDVLLEHVVDSNTFARIAILVCGMVVPLVDTAFNLSIGYLPMSDFSKLADGSRIGLRNTYLAGSFLAALGIWRVFHQAHRIFHGHKSSEDVSLGLSGLTVRF